MKWIPVLLVLLPIACKSSGPKSMDLTDEQEAQLKQVVEDRMTKLPAQVKLSKTQIDDIRPIVETYTAEIFEAARKYHNNPTRRQLSKFDTKTRKIWMRMKDNLGPFMTNAQLNNFLVVYDQVLQEIRTLRLARPAPASG